VRPRGLALALIVALAVAGCGASALTTPVLRDRAADACTAATALEAKISPPTRPGTTLGYLRHAIAVLRRQYASLHGLDAGGAAAPVFRRAVEALAGEVLALRDASAALGRGADPLATFKELQAGLVPLEHRANAAWSKLQIPACMTA
jgi:hypothetical protein